MEKDFDLALAGLMKYRDSISYEYIPGKFIKRICRQYFYSQNGTVYSGKFPIKSLFNLSLVIMKSGESTVAYHSCGTIRCSSEAMSGQTGLLFIIHWHVHAAKEE